MGPLPQQVAGLANRPVHGPLSGDGLTATGNPSRILTHCPILASSWTGHLKLHFHLTPAGASLAACPHHSPKVLCITTIISVSLSDNVISSSDVI
jgi:hypothetical protein